MKTTLFNKKRSTWFLVGTVIAAIGLFAITTNTVTTTRAAPTDETLISTNRALSDFETTVATTTAGTFTTNAMTAITQALGEENVNGQYVVNNAGQFEEVWRNRRTDEPPNMEIGENTVVTFTALRTTTVTSFLTQVNETVAGRETMTTTAYSYVIETTDGTVVLTTATQIKADEAIQLIGATTIGVNASVTTNTS